MDKSDSDSDLKCMVYADGNSSDKLIASAFRLKAANAMILASNGIQKTEEMGASTSGADGGGQQGNSNFHNIMSVKEKMILNQIVGKSPQLPYPLKKTPMAVGPDAWEYVIPDSEKEKVLNELYPFEECPKLDDEMYDIHSGTCFRVCDFRVIRENERNYLVAPRYPESGGMVIDWVWEKE